MRLIDAIRFSALMVTLIFLSPLLNGQTATGWRAATPAELESVLPARAQVEKERIETEMRTASGITNGHGKFIAGVVLITAGYSADGKYSHYLFVQNPIVVGDVVLAPGAYVLGWSRVQAGLFVHLYDAATGTELVSAIARPMPPGVRVEGFRIWPPDERSLLQIGRFALPYSLREPEADAKRPARPIP